MIYQHTARIYNKNRLRLLYIQNNRLLADRLGIHQIKKNTYQHSGPILGSSIERNFEILNPKKDLYYLYFFFQITKSLYKCSTIVHIYTTLYFSFNIQCDNSNPTTIATFFYFSWHVQSRTEMRHTHPLRNYSYIFRNWKKEATTKTPIVIRIKNDLV